MQAGMCRGMLLLGVASTLCIGSVQHRQAGRQRRRHPLPPAQPTIAHPAQPAGCLLRVRYPSAPTWMFWKQLPSLTSRKAKAPAPASRPVFTHPPTRTVRPTRLRPSPSDSSTLRTRVRP